jgi:hypothetical protein
MDSRRYIRQHLAHTHQISANGNKPILLLYTMTKNLWDTQITSTTKKVLLYLIMIYVVVARPLPGHGLDFTRTLYGHYLGLAWSMPGRCPAVARLALGKQLSFSRPYFGCHVMSSRVAGPAGWLASFMACSYTRRRRLRGKTPPSLGHLAPRPQRSQEDIPYHFEKGIVSRF